MRFVLIGCGAWGKNYLKTVQDIPGVEIPTVIRRDSSADFDQLVNEFDGVIVATPPQIHKDFAIPFLRAGVPVLLEKPVAHTYSDAKEIIDAARVYGTTLLVNNIHLFADAFLDLKEKLIHRPIKITSIGGNKGPYREYSSLLDYAPHDLAMCLSLFNGQNPDQVEITKDRVGKGEIHTIRLRFGDSTAHIEVGNGMDGKYRYFGVEQGKNKIEYDDLATSKLKFNNMGIMQTQSPPLTRVVQAFAKSIIGDYYDWRFDHEMNLKVMRIIQEGLR